MKISAKCSESEKEMKNLLGTPETKRKGRKTRKARSAFTSKPSFMILVRTVLNILEKEDNAD